jgi:UDP-glucuronate 4-epimerase
MLGQPILVTSAAGFVGFHVRRQLLAEGRNVVGLDNLNSYYDPALKQSRLDVLLADTRFEFVKADLADRVSDPTLPSRTVSAILSPGTEPIIKFETRWQTDESSP